LGLSYFGIKLKSDNSGVVGFTFSQRKNKQNDEKKEVGAQFPSSLVTPFSGPAPSPPPNLFFLFFLLKFSHTFQVIFSSPYSFSLFLGGRLPSPLKKEKGSPFLLLLFI
jgi:hypothetical protein